MAYTPPGRVIIGPWRETEQDLPLPTARETASSVRDVVALAWKADPRRFAGTVAIGLLSAGAGLVQLRDTGDVVSLLLAERRVPLRRIAVLAGASALAYGGPKLASVLHIQLDESLSRGVTGSALDAIAELELADLEDPLLLDGLQLSSNNASHVAGSLLSAAMSWPQRAVRVLGPLAGITAADAPLVGLSLAAACARRALDQSQLGRSRRVMSKDMRRMGSLRHQLTDAQAGKELLAFGSAPQLRKEYDRLADVEVTARLTNRRRALMGGVLDDLIGAASNAPSLIRVARGALHGRASVGSEVTAGLAGRQVARALNRSRGGGGSVRRSAATWRQHQAFLALARARQATRPTGAFPSGDFERIALRQVGFSYPNRPQPVLSGVDLEVARGEVVALVGENGSGKTTLAKILCGLYPPTGGRVEWNGLDLSGTDPRALRRHLAVVFQDFARFPFLTAAQNIAIGRPESWEDIDAIRSAASQAGAEEAILALPDGYDTVMSRAFGGSDLSVGQWQRVALARAFMRDAPLVVLDEPTAALDP
ncbi:MAG: ATP-binding cassette domain-containing protein, partial [Acidimicrobiales bacterium]